MCQYLDPACFMANVFSVCQDRSTMDFVTLRKVRDHVTHKLEDQNVVIEWTRDAVMGAMESYPNLFEGRENAVAWRGKRDKATVKQNFDGDFSDAFVGKLWAAIEEGCASATHA